MAISLFAKKQPDSEATKNAFTDFVMAPIKDDGMITRPVFTQASADTCHFSFVYDRTFSQTVRATIMKVMGGDNKAFQDEVNKLASGNITYAQSLANELMQSGKFNEVHVQPSLGGSCLVTAVFNGQPEGITNAANALRRSFTPVQQWNEMQMQGILPTFSMPEPKCGGLFGKANNHTKSDDINR